jgi:hypothetical protein
LVGVAVVAKYAARILGGIRKLAQNKYPDLAMMVFELAEPEVSLPFGL